MSDPTATPEAEDDLQKAERKRLWWQFGPNIRIPSAHNPKYGEWRAQYHARVVDRFGEDLDHTAVPLEKLLGGHVVSHDPDKTRMYSNMYLAGDPPPPLIVSAEPNGFYHIIDGNRRHEAARQAKQTHVPCLVIRRAVQQKAAGAEQKPPRPIKPQRLKKSEFEQPAWVQHPKLPLRIQKLFEAVRGALTPELLRPEYRDMLHPLAGHCYVATEALFHLLDGRKTGWARQHVRHDDTSHWFLRHRKTDTVLDPTAEQFATPPPYQDGRGGAMAGPPDYDADKPSKRAQVVIDRVKQRLAKAEEPANEPLQKASYQRGAIREASFRHRKTGEVVNTGPFHDVLSLPHDASQYDQGFTGHDGKFYTREDAARLVGINTPHAELESTGYWDGEADPTVDGLQERRDGPALHPSRPWGITDEAWFVHPKNPLKKSERPLQKSIQAIPPGLALAYNPQTSESLFDYTNSVLPIPLRAQYRIRVHHQPRTNSITTSAWHENQAVGQLVSHHGIQDGVVTVSPFNVLVRKQHRKLGLATALYEATYAHARQHLRAQRVVGDEHTAAADAVHQKLAERHGFEYQPAFRTPEEAGEYEYMLKSEPGLIFFEPSSAWTQQDWDAFEKAVRVDPNQLNLWPDAAEVAANAKPWPPTPVAAPVPTPALDYEERVLTGRLTPQEIEGMLHELEHGINEHHELPGLRVKKFLTSHLLTDRLSTSQREHVLGLPKNGTHGLVEDWIKEHHQDLSDDEFRRVLPLLDASHVDNLPPSRIGIVLDEAKRASKPTTQWEKGTDIPDDHLAYSNAWDMVGHTLYGAGAGRPIPQALATRMLREVPDDYSERGSFLSSLVRTDALTEDQLGELWNECEAKDDLYSYGMAGEIAQRARSDQLQQRILNSSSACPQRLLKENKHLLPSTATAGIQSGRARYVLQNPNLEESTVVELSTNKDWKIRRQALEHPAMPEKRLVHLADNDKRGEVRAAAHKALEWHDPSRVHREHINVRFGTNKLRQVRDLILASGRDEMSPKELPAGDWKAGRIGNGNISAQKLQQHIDGLPATKFGVSEGSWSGVQRHNKDTSYVFQLNLSTEQANKLKDAGVWGTFRKMWQASSRSFHPIGHAGIGWIRWTGGGANRTGPRTGIHIDEVQSDLGQSFVKQAANQARVQGMDPDEAAARAEKDYPEDHYQKIRDIVFGGRHPSEVLQEAFHEWLRGQKTRAPTPLCPKCGSRSVFQEEDGTIKCAGINNDPTPERPGWHCLEPRPEAADRYVPTYADTPIAVWQPESKATISLGHSNTTAKLPGHFYVGYRDVPKKLGMRPSKYGELPTQTNSKHKGKPTWTDVIRKSEDSEEGGDVGSLQEHTLPGSLHAEGYRCHISHQPGMAVAAIHRGGQLLGHVDLSDEGPHIEWLAGQEPRDGLTDAAMMLLHGHNDADAIVDGWHEATGTEEPEDLEKAETAQPLQAPLAPKPQGSHITEPHQTYEAASQAKPAGAAASGRLNRNLWVRNSPDQHNHQRTLMVQFSSDLLNNGRQRDNSDAYYDKLYQNRAGYHRPQDFWEVPQWMPHVAHSLPNADAYVVRDPEEAAAFVKQAGYRNVCFSALDVNKDFIKTLAQQAPDQRFTVGGYTDLSHFSDQPNVQVHPTVQSMVEADGDVYRSGYDYRHFSGTKSIPRLTLSDGCRHQCAFCSVPKQVVEKPREEVMQQVDSFARHLPSDLVYLNDKTFGMAPNHQMLPEIYQRLKARNPNFQGFVIQTTAAQMRKMTPEFIRQSGIRHIELGIESYNDPILRAMKKPANEALIDEATQKIRQSGASLIPNIMVGLPGENQQTYAHTMDWLHRNADVISHVNAYNLALYDETELGQKLNSTIAADRDENQTQKSWHQDPQVHKDFHQALFDFGSQQLDRQPHDPYRESQKDFDLEHDSARKLMSGAIQLRQVPYFDSYQRTAATEAGMLGNAKNVLFIGSGPTPISPILFATQHGKNVAALELDPEAARVGGEVARAQGVELPTTVGDAGQYRGFGNHDGIVVALEAGITEQQKSGIFQRIAQDARPGTRIVVRTSADQTGAFPNVSGYVGRFFNVVGEQPTFDGHSRSLLLEKKPAPQFGKSELAKAQRRAPKRTFHPAVMAFMKDFQAATQSNGFDDRLGRYHNTSDDPKGGSLIDLRPYDTRWCEQPTVSLDWLTSLQERAGHGRRAMEMLTGLADQHGVHLTLQAGSSNNGTGGWKTSPKRMLYRFYGQHGFKRKMSAMGDGLTDHMERPPLTPWKPVKRKVRKAEEHAMFGKSERPMMRSPAFRHVGSGSVVPTVGFHDHDQLAQHLGMPQAEEYPDLYDQWEAGFVDHGGKFYNRQEAAAAVSKPDVELTQGHRWAQAAVGGLESQSYAVGQPQGLYRSEAEYVLLDCVRS